MENRLFLVRPFFLVLVLVVLLFMPSMTQAESVDNLRVVGLYSETAAGSVSYRLGDDNWKKVNLADELPAEAEILIDVARDWVEFISVTNPNAVYEVRGEKDRVIQVTLATILAGGPTREVTFPEASADIDPAFANTLVVKEYLGRQHYIREDGRRVEIKYGDILEVGGDVNIIGINNTLLLALPNGEDTIIIGPIRFTVETILKGENLYKYLNVH
ncbi:MAG TPA: hypothetical protein DDW87_05215 [Firmicutes bacterium]|nr:hypothetical protein [Bacillota bacterium]